jgi:hypothetical protein
MDRNSNSTAVPARGQRGIARHMSQPVNNFERRSIMTRILRLTLKTAKPQARLPQWPALLILLIHSGLCGTAAAQPPPACAQGSPVNAPSRPTARRNYIEIVYDARSRQVWWLDRAGISHGGGGPVVISENSVFAPVTFAKERIIVTICNAKFNTEPSTSVSTTVIPESEPDIRGLAAQATAAPLAAAMVALSTLLPKPGAAETPAPKTEEDYAQLTAAYHEKFQRLMAEMNALRCPPGPQPCALDTIPAIQARADDLAAHLPVPPVDMPLAGDQADFDSFSARTKSLVDNINGLAAALVAGDFLTRATGLAGEFAPLKAAELRAGARPKTISELVAETVTAVAAAKDANARAAAPAATAQQRAIAAATVLCAMAVLKAAGDLQADPTSGALTPTAKSAAQDAEKNYLDVLTNPHSLEEETIARNLRDAALHLLRATQAAGAEKPPDIAEINKRLVRYLGRDITFQWILGHELPERLFQQTDGLTNDVTALHATASAIFDRMNRWREDSRVTLTGIVPPPGGNAVLNVRIILHEAYAPFTFGAPPKKDPSTDTSKTSSGTITAAAATGSGPEQHEVRRVLVEVHRRADANLVGAIIGSTIPNRAFGLQPGPASTTTTTTTAGGITTVTTGGPSTPQYYLAYESQNDHVQIQGIAGINWYPGGRDFYPGYLRGARRLIPGVLFGTSVTAPGNFVGGLDFEPTNGLDFIFGGEVGPIKQLAPGVTLGVTQFAGTDTVPTHQRLTGGFVFGIGFDLSVFSAVFSGGSAPSSSAAPTTPATH